ncbi:MAG: nucleotidyltransferase domain-containing protein [Gammaproteobacteria bacterium]|nr:nucleotidyltransferase domain-containing protein [Gammaproteobacteria bacterium]
MENILKYSFWQRLQQLPFVEKIVLYGSRARQDNQERSDIDIAISCPKATKIDWQKVLNIIENADTLLKIDCVRLDTLSKTNPLLISIQQDGKILYEQRGLS